MLGDRDVRVAIPLALLLAACQAAPRHRPELMTRVGVAPGSPVGSGASSSADALHAGSGDAGAEAGDEGGGYESTCDALASCCATLDALDPARGWCEDALAMGDQLVCSTRLDEMAASGWCPE